MTPDRLDAVARDMAGGTSRRQALRLLGGSVAAGFLALRGVDPADASRRCRRTGEKCRQASDCCGGACCGGACCPEGQICQNGTCMTPPPPVALSREVCICGDGTVLTICADVNCDSGLAQDAICGPACAPHGGEAATGCFAADPACA